MRATLAEAVATTGAPTLYKVIVGDKSVHGGSLEWSLPATNNDGTYTPGDWHRVEPPIVLCSNGLHVTPNPMQWAVVGMEAYVVEVRGERDGDLNDKSAHEEARLLRPAPEAIPDYWRAVERFVREEIPAVPWFQPDGNPDPAWQLLTVNSLDAAYDAALDATRGAAFSAARNAAHNAARDVAFAAAFATSFDAARDVASAAANAAAFAAAEYVVAEHVCGDLPLDNRHREHARAHWAVWQKGYALLCDVGGVLYVYGAER